MLASHLRVDEGGVLSQRESGGGLRASDGLEHLLLGLFNGCEGADEDSGLAVERLVELLLRAVRVKRGE